jgi:hypothetical protein
MIAQAPAHDDGRYGRAARHRLAQAGERSAAGARAALETFYFAFHQRSIEALREVWLDDPLVQLNNPVGGILRGIEPIVALYARVFDGPARVWVELGDLVEADLGDGFVFAGREHGEFVTGETVVELVIRTSRVFAFAPGLGWRQVHHHGSIDDPDLLACYQRAVRSP